MRRISGLAPITTFLVLLAMLLTACGGTTGGGGTTPTTAPSAKVTVGLVTDIGGLNDGGFNQFSHQGYEKARAQYGFPSVVIQSQVISDAEYTKNITAAAQQADMVIGVGFLMQNAMFTVAKQFPTKKFALIDGCPTDPADKTGACQPLTNVAPLFFKEQQAGCLVGAIAGQMELDGKSKVPNLLGKNTISAVGGLAIPPVVRYIAGYKYCAQKVNPAVKVVVGYSNNFNDPTKCAAIAEKQIADNSADILFQVAGGCGIGVLDAATKHNVYSIGVDVDQGKDSTGAPRPSVITSAEKRIDTASYSIINLAEQQGTAATGAYSNYVANPTKFDINNDGVAYATPSSAVPQDAVAKADDFASQMKAGTLVPPEQIP
ncbi:MAG TPA: BMP family ABC transporter substrate-binding protein [Ktedonobacteraceae bacterium]